MPGPDDSARRRRVPRSSPPFQIRWYYGTSGNTPEQPERRRIRGNRHLPIIASGRTTDWPGGILLFFEGHLVFELDRGEVIDSRMTSFSSSKFDRRMSYDASHLPRRGCRSKPRVASKASAPWVEFGKRGHFPEGVAQCGNACTSSSARCLWNPVGVLVLVLSVSQGGAAAPLTLGYVVKPLRGNRLRQPMSSGQTWNYCH